MKLETGDIIYPFSQSHYYLVMDVDRNKGSATLMVLTSSNHRMFKTTISNVTFNEENAWRKVKK